MDPGPISSILLQSSTAIPALLLSAIYFQQTILQPLDTFNPLCSAKPVRLTTSLNSWCKVFWLCVCRFQVAADAGSDRVTCHQLVRNTFRRDAFLLLVDKPWFYKLRETCCCAHHTLLLGFTNYAPQAFIWCHYYIHVSAIKHFSGAVAGEKDHFCKGSLSLSIFLFCFCFACFILFCLLCFIKNPKKISFHYSFYFRCFVFLLKWLLLKIPSCVTLLAPTIVILFAHPLLHLLLRQLSLKLSLLF